MAVALLLTTVGSFSVWYVTAREDQQMTKTVVMDTMDRVQGMNAAITQLRAGQAGFTAASTPLAAGRQVIEYRDGSGAVAIADYYEGGVRVRSEFDARGNGTRDVTELYPAGASVACQVEYDVDDDGLVDAVMTDNNRDGVMDNTEILLNIRGNMMPLSAVPGVFA